MFTALSRPIAIPRRRQRVFRPISVPITFRLASIPTSVTDTKILSALTATFGPKCEIVTVSLFFSVQDQQSQIAIVTFKTLPDKLRYCWENKSADTFPVELEGTVCNVQFDRHFIGFTPLSCGGTSPESSNTTIETSPTIVDIEILYIHPISVGTTPLPPKWLTLLPSSLPSTSRARILSYVHSPSSDESQDIVALAKALVDHIMRTRTQGVHRPMVWIAAGDGGRVAKYALLQTAQSSSMGDVYQCTNGLFLLDCPAVEPWGPEVPGELDESGEVPVEIVNAVLKERMVGTGKRFVKAVTAKVETEAETNAKGSTDTEGSTGIGVNGEKAETYVLASSLSPQLPAREKQVGVDQSEVHNGVQSSVEATGPEDIANTVSTGYPTLHSQLLECIQSAVLSVSHSPPTADTQTKDVTAPENLLSSFPTGEPSHEQLPPIGVEKLRETLDSLLTAPTTKQLTLHGPRGIGKTHFLLQYLRLRSKKFICFWVAVNSALSLWEGFRGIAQNVIKYTAALEMGEVDYLDVAARVGMAGLVDAAGEVTSTILAEEVLVSAVKEWLGKWKGQRWILVLDGPREGFDLKQYIPENGEGVVVCIDSSWNGVGVSVNMEAICQDAGVRILLGGRDVDQSETEAAKRLSKRLQFISLAHTLAAGYMTIYTITAEEYLNVFIAKRDMLGSAPRARWTEREKIPLAAFEINFQTLQEIHPKAAELFNCYTFLEREVVGELLITAYKLLNGVDESEDIITSKAITPLFDYSLMEQADNSKAFQAAHLLYRYGRKRLSRPGRHHYARHVLTLISNSSYTLAKDHLRMVNPIMWDPLVSCPPNLSILRSRLRVAKLYQDANDPDKTVSILRLVLKQASGVLPPNEVIEIVDTLCGFALEYGDQDFSKRAEVLIDTIDFSLGVLGKEAASVRKATNMLHRAYIARVVPCQDETLLKGLGKHLEANLLLKLLRDYVMIGKGGHVDAVEIVERLAKDSASKEVEQIAYHCTIEGKHREAKGIYYKLLETRQRQLGREHKETLAIAWSLIQTYFKISELDEMVALLKEMIPTPKDIEIDRFEGVLSKVVFHVEKVGKQGRILEVGQLYEGLLELCKRLLGVKHKNTLSLVQGLAVIYMDQRRVDEEAMSMYEALLAQKDNAGEAHPETITVMVYLADMHMRNKTKTLDEAAEMYFKIPGESLQLRYTKIRTVASEYEKQGQWDEAGVLYKKILESLRKEIAEGHELVGGHGTIIHATWRLANCHRARHEWETATSLHSQLLAGDEKGATDCASDTDANIKFEDIHHIIQIHHAIKTQPEGKEVLSGVLDGWKKALSIQDDEINDTMRLILTTFKSEAVVEEEKARLEALEYTRCKLGMGHATAISTLEALAYTYYHRNQWGIAKRRYLELLEIQLQVLGKFHPDRLDAMKYIIITYTLLNDWEGVEDLVSQLASSEIRTRSQVSLMLLSLLRTTLNTHTDTPEVRRSIKQVVMWAHLWLGEDSIAPLLPSMLELGWEVDATAEFFIEALERSRKCHEKRDPGRLAEFLLITNIENYMEADEGEVTCNFPVNKETSTEVLNMETELTIFQATPAVPAISGASEYSLLLRDSICADIRDNMAVVLQAPGDEWLFKDGMKRICRLHE